MEKLWETHGNLENQWKLWKNYGNLENPWKRWKQWKKLLNLLRIEGKLLEFIREIGSTDGNTGWKLDGK